MKSIFIFLSAFLLSIQIWAAETKVIAAQITAKEVISGQEKHIALTPKQKAMVVVFLSAKCPCSDSHVEALQQLYKKFPDMNFVAVHSNVDEAADMSRDYFKKAKLPFPVLQDEGLKLADQFSAYKTPHAFVLSPKGELLYQGGVSDSKHFDKSKRNFLDEALSDVQAVQEVRTKEGRTLGCMITRGDTQTPWSSK